jgi:non-ribosomal peptide synthetase component F
VPGSLPPLPVQYADFALWQRASLDGAALDAGVAYWTAQLAGMPADLDLPTDRPRPVVPTFDADACHVVVPAGAVAVLTRVSRAHQTTLHMTLVAALGALLSRYTRQDDIAIGMPIANRDDATLERLVGFFVNPLVLRIRTSGQQTFRQLLADVRRTMLEAYQHQDVPFERLVQALAPKRAWNRAPLFQVGFVFQQDPFVLPPIADATVEPLAGDAAHVRVDLEIYAYAHDDRLRVSWFYNRALFDRATVEQIARHYVSLLTDAADHLDERIDRLELADTGARHSLMEGFNARA